MANINKFIILGAVICYDFVSCSENCGKVFEKDVPLPDQEIIVRKHNELRSLVNQGKVLGQPKAKGLGPLKWDADLARAAQEIANSCEFRHVSVNDRRFYVGQNLAWGGSNFGNKGGNWNSVIQSWFDEYKQFKYPTTSVGVTGHYTQVVWEDTQYVGCGFVIYSANRGWYEKLYVCNYGPGGNVMGQPPYRV